MILTDEQIRALAFIAPWSEMIYRDDVLSYGLSSMGYDARLGCDFLKYRDGSGPLDPKRFKPEQWNAITAEDPLVLDACSFYLAHSIEFFEMPDDLLGWCVNKSSYARNALSVDVTPLEPAWPGQVTFELRTHTAPVIVYPGEGSASSCSSAPPPGLRRPMPTRPAST